MMRCNQTSSGQKCIPAVWLMEKTKVKVMKSMHAGRATCYLLGLDTDMSSHSLLSSCEIKQQLQSSLYFSIKVTIFCGLNFQPFDLEGFITLHFTECRQSINQSICVYFKHDNRTFVTIFGSDKTYT